VRADPDPDRSRRYRRIASILPFAISAFLFGVLLRSLLHDHAGEFRMTHEWDMMTIPIISTVALVPMFAGLGLWRGWSSPKTWLWILASPLVGGALLLPLLWFAHLVNPLPP
jgi:predicted membrane protein